MGTETAEPWSKFADEVMFETDPAAVMAVSVALPCMLASVFFRPGVPLLILPLLKRKLMTGL